MCLAKARDVDMVLLGGDLFHDNKPSRKSMYNVMRSMRLNCLGDKPCELEMLSDESEHFDTTFGHVNYEDANINVGIPIFSIHGNHDDPTGDGHYSALDLLAVSGLVNYFGRVPESDNIVVKPVLIQKGRTKLALYGLSNVRDERLYQTFRQQKVKFHRPGTHQEEWYNLMCVHQNHAAHTDGGYLPENFLPDFLDLVIWGHEHECEIEPKLNPEMNFKVMQPGSSVATSLIPGEAVPKHVAILTIRAREMKCEKIPLKSVRPFVYHDIVLANDRDAVKIAKRKDDHRAELTNHLINIVDGLIKQAKQEWTDAQDPPEHPEDDPEEAPLPLIRLRVETTPADGITRFDIENPQRFSNRFIDRVANVNDVVQFHVKKKNAAAKAARDAKADAEMFARIQGLEGIKVDKLVREFLEKQSLQILPTNYFGDAVTQYVDKDDKHAMEVFVNQALSDMIKKLQTIQKDKYDADDDDEEDLATQIEAQRSMMEELFAKGLVKVAKTATRFKPRPDDWDSDLDGEWEAQPAALIRDNEDLQSLNGEDDEDGTPEPSIRGTGRGRGGRGRGRGGRVAASAASTSTRETTTAKKPATRKTRGNGRKRTTSYNDEDEEEDSDIIMADDNGEEDEEDDSQAIFVPQTKRMPAAKAIHGTRTASPAASTTSSTTRAMGSRAKPTSAAPVPARKTPARGATASRGKQSTLSFTTSQASILGRKDVEEISDDDDEDAFEPAPAPRRRR
jgi:double-strand break repair protein MRE11